MTLCECGCGQETNIYRGKPNRFIYGHHRRGVKVSNPTMDRINTEGLTQDIVRELFDYRDGGLYWKVSGSGRKIGFLPEFLDHIDGDRLNNDITNLREATKQENGMNRKKNKSYGGKPTSSEFKGVYWDEHAKKWRSRIQIDGKKKHLGFFASETEAAIAYNASAIKHFDNYARLNIISHPHPL